MIIHCPLCKKIVVKGFDEIVLAEVDFSFSGRCPHCQKDVTIVVKFETDTTPLEVVRVIKSANIVVAQRNIHLAEDAGSGPKARVL